jgi:hypothetical protein
MPSFNHLLAIAIVLGFTAILLIRATPIQQEQQQQQNLTKLYEELEDMEFDYFALVAKMFRQIDANKASDIF